jgi:hypothetical protein
VPQVPDGNVVELHPRPELEGRVIEDLGVVTVARSVEEQLVTLRDTS